MLVTRLTCLLPLVLAGGTALAQSELAPKRHPGPIVRTPQEVQAIKERVADWLKTCLGDWDQATHMTKEEWRVTCGRVAAEREQFLLQNPSMELPAAGARKTRAR